MIRSWNKKENASCKTCTDISYQSTPLLASDKASICSIGIVKTLVFEEKPHMKKLIINIKYDELCGK